jgi:hypothetical protein
MEPVWGGGEMGVGMGWDGAMDIFFKLVRECVLIFFI